MTLKEFIDTIIGDIDEDTNDLTLRSRVKKYINRAYKELAKREGIEKKLTLVPVNNVVYKPYDLIKIHEIKVDDNLIPFDLVGRNINVNTTLNVELIYNYSPAELEAEDDETVTSPANDEFIVNYAKWLYYLQEGETDNAAIYKNEYKDFKILTHARVSKVINVYGW